MAKGSDTYMGLAAPLFGNFEVKGRSTTLDVLHLNLPASGTGDYLVCTDSTGTENLIIEDSGRIVVKDWPVLQGTIATTAPTTGLTSGQLFFYEAANVRQFAVADAAGTLWRIAMTNN